MRAVFLDQQTLSASVVLAPIQAIVAELCCYDMTSPDQIIERSKKADILITNKVGLTADILTELPQLKLICIAATGTNNIDIECAKKLGIAVCNVSGYANQSVTQYVFAQILAYFNQTHHHHQNTQQGLWQQSKTFCYHGLPTSEIANKTLGIVGYGSLGQAVAAIGKAFGMRVLVAERPNAKRIRGDRLAFDEVIKQADILSLHCPQTPDTEQLINARVLLAMKNTAMLINTARGALIDDDALIEALRQQQIAYAVLDVLDQEPPSSTHKLLNCQLTNLSITAHIAWASIEAQQRLVISVADNIASFLNGQQRNRVD